MQKNGKLIDEGKRLYDGGASVSDIAKTLGVPASTVRSWKSRYKWDAQPRDATQRSAPQRDASSGDTITVYRPLTDCQELFCAYYVKCFNAAKAYMRAYNCTLSVSAPSASRLMRDPRIRARIDELKTARLSREMLSEDDIFQKYIDIAFADVTDYVVFASPTVKENGVITAKNMILLKSSDTVDGTLLDGISISSEGSARIQLPDRMKALAWLSEHMDLCTAEQKARIKALEAKLPVISDTPDDGFLKALSGSAAKDWGDDDE